MIGHRAHFSLFAALTLTLLLRVPALGLAQPDSGASGNGGSGNGPGAEAPAIGEPGDQGSANRDDGKDAAGNERTDELTGHFVVATPSLDDPNFSKSVIFIVRHDANGAFGIVVNKLLGTGPTADILQQFGVNEPDAKGNLTVHFGGPVGTFSAFIIHSTDYKDSVTQVITPEIAVTSDNEILSKIARGEGPRQSLVAVGYAGWGPGQLEGEIGRGAWYIAPADLSILFSGDLDSEWSRAIATGGVDL